MKPNKIVGWFEDDFGWNWLIKATESAIVISTPNICYIEGMISDKQLVEGKV